MTRYHYLLSAHYQNSNPFRFSKPLHIYEIATHLIFGKKKKIRKQKIPTLLHKIRRVLFLQLIRTNFTFLPPVALKNEPLLKIHTEPYSFQPILSCNSNCWNLQNCPYFETTLIPPIPTRHRVSVRSSLMLHRNLLLS